MKQYVQISLTVSQTYLKYPLEVVEIEEGVVFEDEQFLVETLPLQHGIPSYGYRIVEKDRPGTLHADKLAQAGVKPGPIYKKIKNGEDVTLEDGTVIEAKKFLGSAQKGRVVTILGDTRKCENAAVLARGADLLVHEATFAKGEEGLAHDYFHSTTHQAAQIALAACVKKLCLTHISSRYDREASKELLLEAKELFAETELAEDFKELEIPLVKS